MRTFKKKQRMIGIDISDRSIDIVELDDNRHVLLHIRREFEDGIVENGEIKNKERLSAILTELIDVESIPPLRENSDEQLEVSLCIPESRVYTHSLTLTETEGDDPIFMRVKKAASEIIPENPQDLYFDFHAVKQNGAYNVMFLAALRRIVNDYIEVLQRTNVTPISIENELTSLARSIICSQQRNERADVMLVDIGARTTNVGVVDKDRILRESIIVPVAGEHLTAALVTTLGLSRDDAEDKKRRFGFTHKSKKVFDTLESNFKPIVGEVKKLINFYENKEKAEIKSVYIVGGSALLKDVDRYLEQKLHRDVFIGDPLCNIARTNELQDASEMVFYANVIGLALRDPSKSDTAINFGINFIRSNQEGFDTKDSVTGSRFTDVYTVIQNIPLKLAGAILFVLLAFSALYSAIVVSAQQQATPSENIREGPDISHSSYIGNISLKT